MDGAGDLYGITQGGGVSGDGTVFELTPPTSQGGAWTETILYNFNQTANHDGLYPEGGLVFDAAGNLYGTTRGDSVSTLSNSYGTVFQLSPPSILGGSWTLTTIYGFSGATNGCSPEGYLTLGRDGALYGTTSQCGGTQLRCSSYFYGCGTAFKVTPPALQGGAWTERTIYRFASGKDGNDGENPIDGVISDPAGNLYGTTDAGGGSRICPYEQGCGTVFKISRPATVGTNWTESVIYRFTGGTGGAAPFAHVIADSAGNLYGTTFDAGPNCAPDLGYACGAVFELAPPSIQGGTWTEITLHDFNGAPDGGFPAAGLIFSKGGTIYGTTLNGGVCPLYSVSGCGTVFQIVP